MRVRSKYFAISGAIGGFAGFIIMEIFSAFFQVGSGRLGNVAHMAFYFAGFGLTVGAALGMTEGFVLKKRSRLIYGLSIGLILGVVGGFIGGAVGQTIFGLVPMKYARPSTADIAIALDSSGSMRQMMVLGNDPWGERKKAARKLIDRLSTTDRVTIVDFDAGAKVLYPLSFLDSRMARKSAKGAVLKIDSDGGTSLDAGLMMSIQELANKRIEGRNQHIIFLTDGQGQYHPETALQAERLDIVVHTIGLGEGVDAALLERIARETGGKYYPVEQASSLSSVFDRIFTENIDMTTHEAAALGDDAAPITNPFILLLARVLSWAAMGIAIGAGQGVRENTREDLLACSVGGLIGGAIGGVVFNPVCGLISFGGGMIGLAIADTIVGGCIGGSMRIAQERMVEASSKPSTTLLRVLPEKTGIVEFKAEASPPAEKTEEDE